MKHMNEGGEETILSVLNDLSTLTHVLPELQLQRRPRNDTKSSLCPDTFQGIPDTDDFSDDFEFIEASDAQNEPVRDTIEDYLSQLRQRT